jgi:CheY-like chemotaxis protein
MSSVYDLLIVDDEQVVVDGVVRICSEEQLKVDSALDAQDALAKVAKNAYRLILCDIMMPGMDGFQFLEKIKQSGISSAFIMTTGYSTIENAVRSLYLGAIDFLPKPFTVDEFNSAVKRGLKYDEMRRQTGRKKARKRDAEMFYVPCPAKYLRLGYNSWVNRESTGSVKIGVTDLFLKTIDPVSGISLFEKEQEILQGNPCATLTTRDEMQHGILSPITGRIIEKNSRILEDVTLIEKDPFFEGWLYRVIPSDLAYQMKYLIPGSSEEL